jgi:nitroreductase
LTDAEIRDLAECASLAPSAQNRQPWRFVFVTAAPQVALIRKALVPENDWARRCATFIAVFSSPRYAVSGPGEPGRPGPVNYCQFDTGLACAFLMLRAVELGLVAHPISGFDEGAVRKALRIPARDVDPETHLLVLLAVGKRASNKADLIKLDEALADHELVRPKRLRFGDFVFLDTCATPLADPAL